MKRMIIREEAPLLLNIVIDAYDPILYIEDLQFSVAAKIDLSKYKLPSGPVISKFKKRITQQMVDDFDAFMDMIEGLCEDNYDLVGTYKSVSNDHSYYYNYLAKDDNGKIIVKFRLRLRISNHPAKKSKQQKQNKQSELDSEELKRLLSEVEINKLRKYTKVITINSEKFDSYEQAFEYVDSVLEDAVEKMKDTNKN